MTDTRQALAELVACKDLADQFDALKQDVHDFATAAVLEGIQAEYQRRKPLAWANARAALAAQPVAPKGFALVPLRMNVEMQRAVEQEDWQWEDLLDAAESITLEQYDEIAAQPVEGEVAWISPKDKVPKGGEVVLCLFRDMGIHTALFRGMSTTHGVFEAWHGFLTADLPSDRVIGWVPLASALSTPPPGVVEAVPIPDCTVADVGFRWDMEAQWHVPQVLVEFEPTPPNSPADAKGWKDRDAFAAFVKSRGIAPKAAPQEKT